MVNYLNIMSDQEGMNRRKRGKKGVTNVSLIENSIVKQEVQGTASPSESFNFVEK